MSNKTFTINSFNPFPQLILVQNITIFDCDPIPECSLIRPSKMHFTFFAIILIKKWCSFQDNYTPYIYTLHRNSFSNRINSVLSMSALYLESFRSTFSVYPALLYSSFPSLYVYIYISLQFEHIFFL